jgi:chromosome segregation ATPase
MKKTAYIVLLASALMAEDIMVERMQSVVDEVIELRSRYESSARNNEACQKQVREQARIIEEASQSEGLDYKAFEENRKRLDMLEEENSALKKSLAANSKDKGKSKEVINLEKELEVLLEENARLNTSAKILVDKNHSLLDQLNALKRTKGSTNEISKLKTELLTVQEKLKTSQALNRDLEQKVKHLSVDVTKTKKSENSVDDEKYRLLLTENSDLKKELQASKTKTASLEKKCVPKTITKIKKVTKRVESKSICLDENPFPQLMMKEDKAVEPVIPKKRLIDKEEAPNSLEEVITEDLKEVILEKGRTYRLKQESAIYDVPHGKVIAVWEEKTSFTSNIYKGKWIKITGYFVNMKWKKSTEVMWVKAKDALER